MPVLYVLDLIARRYGIAPWTIDPEDPVVYRGLRRAMVVMDMEEDRDAAIRKRLAKPRVRTIRG